MSYATHAVFHVAVIEGFFGFFFLFKAFYNYGHSVGSEGEKEVSAFYVHSIISSDILGRKC